MADREPFVRERRVVLVPRHVDSEFRCPLEFRSMADAAGYLGVSVHEVRSAFMGGHMVTSLVNGRSFFVDGLEVGDE